ncbi:MAG: hypothetical protein QM496_00565, partial [Verrucomicrobiota bacterium]
QFAFISFAPTVLNDIAQCEALGKKSNSSSPARAKRITVSSLTILSCTRVAGVNLKPLISADSNWLVFSSSGSQKHALIPMFFPVIAVGWGHVVFSRF